MMSARGSFEDEQIFDIAAEVAGIERVGNSVTAVTLATGVWTHVAAVYDGERLLGIDGGRLPGHRQFGSNAAGSRNRRQRLADKNRRQ